MAARGAAARRASGDGPAAKKKTRAFRAEWKEGRPWLVYEAAMTCSMCDIAYHRFPAQIKPGSNPNQFLSINGGSSNFQLSALTVHKDGDPHKLAEQWHRKQLGTGVLVTGFNDDINSQLQVLFRTLLSMGQRSVALGQLDDELKNLKANGVKNHHHA
eukprot:gene15531-biopygen9256